MRNKLLLALFLAFFFIPTIGFPQNISDYLILQDIGQYKLDRPEKVFAGEPPIGGPRQYDSAGIIAATGHFADHPDKTYEVMYIGGNGLPSPTVQVTKHAGSDSDKWLLHEVETGFRFGDYEEDMRPSRFRNINGNNVFYTKLGGGTYWWISNNIVVAINYTDLYQQKPEPLEVVKTYLAKFPSTVPAMTIDQAHNEKWIKDEMDRRLWLCDKWFMALQLGKAKLDKVLRESVDYMNIFLGYREKYYGVSARKEKGVLWEYLQAKNGTAIKNKLAEYKSWWEANKDKLINL